MRTIRRILFWCVVGIYLIACPLTILYALGYVFKPGVGNRLMKTGLIYLATAPPGATIYVSTSRYIRRTPAILRNLLPGDYSIRLSLKDYQPWTRIVPVRGEHATVLQHIILFPNNWKPQILTDDAFESLVPVSAARVLLLSRGPRLQDMVVYDRRTGSKRPLFATRTEWLNAVLLELFTVPDSPYVVLRIDLQGSERFLHLDLDDADGRPDDVTRLLQTRPMRLDWPPLDRRHLFVLQDGYLSRLDLASRAVYPHLVEHIRGYGFCHRTGYVLTEDMLLHRMEFDARSAEPFTEGRPIDLSALHSNSFIRIGCLSNEALTFWSERGQLLVTDAEHRLIEQEVRGIEPDSHRQRVLVWRRDRLGILERATSSDDNGPARPPAIRWVYPQGKHIEQAFWVHGDAHVLLRDDDRLVFVELETAGTARFSELWSVKRGSSIAYNDESGKIEYLDRDTGRLCAVEFLPKRELLSLSLPERAERQPRHDPSAP